MNGGSENCAGAMNRLSRLIFSGVGIDYPTLFYTCLRLGGGVCVRGYCLVWGGCGPFLIRLEVWNAGRFKPCSQSSTKESPVKVHAGARVAPFPSKAGNALSRYMLGLEWPPSL